MRKSPKFSPEIMEPETMAMTGHHSVATVMGYFLAESSLNSKAGRMLDED